MQPATCRIRHEPPLKYGDCLRACIATVMDRDTEQVPHFADLGASGEEALAHARRWLGRRNLTIATFAFPGDMPLSDVLDWMGQANPTVTWLLFGSTAHPDMLHGGGDHVVVCQGGEIVHDPAWVRSSIKSATSAGIWQIWVIARV